MKKQPSRQRSSITRAQLVRIAKIQRAIESGKYFNAPQLAMLLEVHERTFQRDLVCMRDQLGHEIEVDPVKNGYYYKTKVAPVAAIHATEEEITAISVAKGAVAEFRGTRFEKPLVSAFNKLYSSWADHDSLADGKWDDIISFHNTVKPILKPDVFHMLAEGAAQRIRLWMRYRRPNHPISERFIDPYHLAKVNGEWFLFAYDHKSNEHRTFAPIRILDLKVTQERFKRRSDFSLEERLSECFLIHQGSEKHDIVVEFNRDVADYIREKIWPGQQEIRELDHGGVELRLKLSSLDEVKRWIITYGGNADVIQPLALEEKLYRDAQDIIATIEKRRAARQAQNAAAPSESPSVQSGPAAPTP